MKYLCKSGSQLANVIFGSWLMRVGLIPIFVSCCVFAPAVLFAVQDETKPASGTAPKKETPASESEIWEYSPYQVRVWIAYDVLPQFSESMHKSVGDTIVDYAAVVDDTGWRFDIQDAPPQFRHAIVHDLDSFEFSKEELLEDYVANGDKLMLVGISRDDLGLHVSTREYDCRANQFSSVVHRDVVSLEQLPMVVYRSIQQAFVPLARVTAVEDKTVSALLRAGGLLLTESDTGDELVRNTGSPAWIPEDAICSPYSRRMVRKRVLVEGSTTKKKTVNVTLVNPIDWTYCLVDEITNLEKEPILKCTLHSAMRSPLGGSRGSRTERVLRLCKPNYDRTTLFLTDRKVPPNPVDGYKIYEVLPGDKPAPENLVGRTGWQGTHVVEKGEHRMLVVYVMSGSRSLARLPIVPGLKPELTAAMYNDAVRIRAEGIVRAMQSNLLNLIAQRQSLAVQIRAALERGELQQADELMQDFKLLESGESFLNKIEGQADTLRADDVKQQGRINTMFNELRKLVLDHLTTELNISLTSEIAFVRGGGKYIDLKPDQLEELKRKAAEEGQ